MTSGRLRVVFLDAASLPRVLVFDPDLNVEYLAYDATQPEEVAGRIEQANVVITNKVRLGAAELRRAPALKLICIAAARTDNGAPRAIFAGSFRPYLIWTAPSSESSGADASARRRPRWHEASA